MAAAAAAVVMEGGQEWVLAVTRVVRLGAPAVSLAPFRVRSLAHWQKAFRVLSSGGWSSVCRIIA